MDANDITVAEASRITGLSVRLIQYHVKAGHLSHSRHGQRVLVLDRRQVEQFKPNPPGRKPAKP